MREGTGLCANFMLRNMVDNQGSLINKSLRAFVIVVLIILRIFDSFVGIDVTYELYDPKIQNIEVLRLEKRLDTDLLYLRDAEPEFTTFPFDMEPEYLPEGTPVPVNPIKVRINRQVIEKLAYLPLPFYCRTIRLQNSRENK